MKIKVCGMKYPDNITSVSELAIDMMGFIFYPLSPRYAGALEPEALSVVPSSIQKTGVFVNEPVDHILRTAGKFDLQTIQLHGNEIPEHCIDLKNKGFSVIKAFSVECVTDFHKTIPYEEACDYFLFDTKTSLYGGSGKQYDWNILDNYTGMIPFFLSGGIGPEDSERLRKFKHPKLYAVDLNSRFEIEPGRKDKELLMKFILNTL